MSTHANIPPFTDTPLNALTREQQRVRESKQQDSIAFESIVRRHSRLVFRVAHALLRNTGDAEDTVQETFLKLHRNGAWKDMRDERAFLARTAWRLALDRKRSTGTPSHVTDTTHLESLRSPAHSPEQSAIAGDFTALLHSLIDALPEELRQPLALSALEELNSREISEILDVKEGTVRTRLMRARQLLKEQLQRHSGGHHAR